MNNKEKEIVDRFKRAGKDIPQEFFDSGVINMLTSENKFMWNGKKYCFLAVDFEPSITMCNVDDETDTIAFSITSELKDELAIVDK